MVVFPDPKIVKTVVGPFGDVTHKERYFGEVRFHGPFFHVYKKLGQSVIVQWAGSMSRALVNIFCATGKSIEPLRDIEKVPLHSSNLTSPSQLQNFVTEGGMKDCLPILCDSAGSLHQ